MNVREEDRQKSNCSGRGLGLAAAAIGVGVGAALYYFFSKGPENPGGEGSTSSWSEQPHALNATISSEGSNEDSYLTISEHSTTDTSINTSLESEITNADTTFDDSSVENDSDSYETGYRTMPLVNVSSGSDITEWDVTTSSAGIPEARTPSPLAMMLGRVGSFTNLSPLRRNRTSEEEQMAILRDQAFRERTWSLEECSICFDIILKDQQVTTLPCTHHFHSACIAPWLQEQQTCPNCRKTAE